MVVQAEYAYAINKFRSLAYSSRQYSPPQALNVSRYYGYSSYRHRRSRSQPYGIPCISSSMMAKLFDRHKRARYALKYIQNIARSRPNINFIGYSETSKLPPLNASEEKRVGYMWEKTWNTMSTSHSWNFHVDNFTFPKNVEVLYDPRRYEACQQYRKFGDVTAGSSMNAQEALALLLVVSIKLHREKGSYTSIIQMLRHFVAYTFDGVRCVRAEGREIRIPNLLMTAYARNVGFIYGSSAHIEDDDSIVPEAVLEVFKKEVHSLTSYESWGHIEYARLSGRSSIPFIWNSAVLILSSSAYDRVKKYAIWWKMHHVTVATERELRMSGREEQKCKPGYDFLSRPGYIENRDEHCCGSPCLTWAKIAPSSWAFPAELCCIRCNQFNQCPAGIQELDAFDNNWSIVVVPQYGTSSRTTYTLVRL